MEKTDELRHALQQIQNAIEGEPSGLKEAWNLLSNHITDLEAPPTPQEETYRIERPIEGGFIGKEYSQKSGEHEDKGQTAEEILMKHLPKGCYWEEMGNLTNTPKEYVLKAMNEFASQSSIEARKIYLVQTKQLLIVGCFSTEEKAKKYAGAGDVMIQEVEVF